MNVALVITWFGLSMFVLGLWEATWIWYMVRYGSPAIKKHLKPGTWLAKNW